jgi:hypothetical protein
MDGRFSPVEAETPAAMATAASKMTPAHFTRAIRLRESQDNGVT